MEKVPLISSSSEASALPHYPEDSTQCLIPETDAVFSKGNNNFSIASMVTGHKNQQLAPKL